jgi:hypothetical protein
MVLDHRRVRSREPGSPRRSVAGLLRLAVLSKRAAIAP